MKFGLWCAFGLLAGVVLTGPARAADLQRTAQEQAMLDQLRASFKAQGLPLSPEMEEAMVQRMRKVRGEVVSANVLSAAVPDASPMQQLAIVAGSLRQDGVLPAAPTGTLVATPATAVVSAPVAGMSATDLQSAIAERHAQGARTEFEQRADGFLANGRPVIDPAGRIEMFGGDAASGDVTYFVRTGPDQLSVRFANVNSTLPPITVGAVAIDGDTERFASVDGQTVAGSNVIPTGRGVVVARDSAVFGYRYGEALTTVAMPDGYRLAPYQRGDVAGTGYVLLRRDISGEEKRDALKHAVGMFKALAGENEEQDYALLNVASSKLVFLNVDESGEHVQQGVNCRRQNAFVNKCTDQVSYEALFKPDGMRNLGHYYWRIDWTATAQGPTALVLARGLRDLNVIRLDSGQRVTAFTRPMGIHSFATERLDNGSLKLHARVGFSNKEVSDIDSLFTASDEPAGVTIQSEGS